MARIDNQLILLRAENKRLRNQLESIRTRIGNMCGELDMFTHELIGITNRDWNPEAEWGPGVRQKRKKA